MPKGIGFCFLRSKGGNRRTKWKNAQKANIYFKKRSRRSYLLEREVKQLYRYILKEERTVLENMTYTAYGLLIVQEDEKRNNNEVYITDVFTDLCAAKKFIKLCNDEQLEPVHIFDVLDDIL